MIQATELRIGNLTDAGKVVEILEDKFYVNDGESSLSSGWYDIKPEPLTEEWLKRFGFTMKDNGFNKDKPLYSTLPVYSIGEHGFWVYYDIKYNSVKGATIDYLYVHQLQNLYHALTGEELTIK